MVMCLDTRFQTHAWKPMRLGFLVFLGVFCLLSGCGSGGGRGELTSAEQNLEKFGRLYFAYRTVTGSPPATAAELKTWARSKLGKDKRKEMGIDDLDKVCDYP